MLCVGAYALTTPPANCTPFPVTFNNGVGGPTPVSCPAFTVPGGTLTGVALTYSADYQFGSGGTNTVAVTFAPAGPGGVTWTPASQTLQPTGGVSSGGAPSGGASATAGVSNANFAAPFNVNVSSAIVQGTVATSAGAVSIVYTYDPPPALNLVCPASTGTVGVPYSSGLIATGGVPGYTYSIIGGALPPGNPAFSLNPATGLITGTPTTAGPFNFTAQVVDSVGGVAGTQTANCTITIADIPPPPPPSNGCPASAATLTYPSNGNGLPPNAFLVRYAANLNIVDSLINVTNSGYHGAPPFGPGIGPPIGNICVNVYAFSADEQMVSCCSCLVTPNALVSLSVKSDIVANTLTGLVPNSVAIKLVASLPGTNELAGGMHAWGTTGHVPGPFPVPGAPAPFAITETPFIPATLSPQELTSMTNRCTAIIGNGSSYGVCAGCRLGGLGAVKQ